MEIPPSLKALKPYLTHAKQTGKFDPLIAYYCRCYAVQLGIELNKQAPHPDNKNALLSLLDKLDSEKKELGNTIEQDDKKAPYVKQFALKVFDKADADDRSGKATRETARAFYAASIFFSIMKQFTNDGVLEEEVEEKLKYAKWKAADINLAFKEGRRPTPGPAGMVNEEDEFKIEEEKEADPASGGADALSSPNNLVGNNYGNLNSNSFDQPMNNNIPSSQFQSPNPQPMNQYSPPISQQPVIQQFQQPQQQFQQFQQPQQQFQQPVMQQYQQPQQQFQQFPQTQNVQQPPLHPVIPGQRPTFVTYKPTEYDTMGRTDDSIDRAMRHAKYAVSSLQFEDVGSAITNLKLALKDLGINV